MVQIVDSTPSAAELLAQHHVMLRRGGVALVVMQG